MKDIDTIVLRAADQDSATAARHEAFGELVTRFQDMAFGCAFAVLGDAYLAQDIAQEAFVVAWQKLAQLREPAAFPGWFKRIVLTQCNRLTRCNRLQVVPLEAGANASANDPGPHDFAERRELLTKVLQAINALPENERLATTLFYVNGYTQADIGEFLEVPVSTVNKRLYTARQRLKESVVQLFKNDLQQQRPSRDKNFSNNVKTKLRPFHEPDWQPVSDIASSRAGGDTPGYELWLNRRQKFDESRYFRRHYVVENPRTKQIIAYGGVEQTIYLPRYVLVLLADAHRVKSGVCDLLLDQLMNDAREAKAITVSCRLKASDSELIGLVESRGFNETSRITESRLNLATADVSSLPDLQRSLEEQGIEISTFEKERVNDPRCVEKLYELNNALMKSAFTPARYNAREALMWLEMPYVLPDGLFIAKQDNEYIGVSDVSLYEAVPGGLTQGFVGVKREYRRRGLATALILSEIQYGQTNGYQLIQSFNKSALNTKLGFECLQEQVTLEQCLKEVVSIDPQLYDEFAGHYRADKRPELELIVSNEAGRLTAECAGQKVQLFPMSDSSFFVKQFYGEMTFQRDEEGRVNHLDLVMRIPNSEPSDLIHATRIH